MREAEVRIWLISEFAEQKIYLSEKLMQIFNMAEMGEVFTPAGWISFVWDEIESILEREYEEIDKLLYKPIYRQITDKELYSRVKSRYKTKQQISFGKAYLKELGMR